MTTAETPVGLRVMVVDDTRLMRELATSFLRQAGVAQVITCNDGAAALAVLDEAQQPVDLILLDLNMPVMDGIEVLRHLSTRRYNGGVALVSSENLRVLRTAETLARTHNLNILGCLAKPLTLAALQPVLALAGAQTGRQVLHPDEPVTEAELQAGIRDGQISIEVQPKVDLRSRQLVGVEALARWHHPHRGRIGPGRFMPIAEAGAAAQPLFEAVLLQSLQAAARWRALGLKLKISVNVSTANLGHLRLPDQVATATADCGLAPEDVMLEVTESRLIQDLAAALEVLTRLRMKGFGLSIDDFGTGYASLEQLQRIPFDELKIDRQFVAGAAQDDAARAILRSSVGLARTLGLTAVAEGIETREDWDCAQRMGCDLAQGFMVAKPMPPDQLPAWAAAWI